MYDRYRLFDGTLTRSGTETFLDNFRIEAWSSTAGKARFLGSTITNADGSFTLELPESDSRVQRALFKTDAANPGVDIIVFHEENDTSSTVVTWNLTAQPYTLQVSVGDLSLNPITNNRVAGVVHHTDGHAISALLVKVFKVEFGSVDSLLSSGNTAPDGRFSINYDPSGTADVVVRVFKTSPETQLAYSDLLYDVADFERLYLEVNDDAYAGPSEWSALHNSLDAIINPSPTPVDLDTINGEDIVYLAEKNDLDPVQVTRYIAAHKLSQRTDYGSGATVPAATIYALLSEGQTPSLASMADIEEDRLQLYLSRAAANGRIKDNEVLAIATLRTAFGDVQKEELSTVSTGTNGRGYTLGDILNTSITGPGSLTTTEQKSLVNLYRTHSGTTVAFWTAWDALTPSSNATNVKFRLEAAEIVLQHTEMLSELFSTHSGITTGIGLADLSKSEWESLIDDAIITPTNDFPDGVGETGDTSAQKKTKYTQVIRDQLERRYPSRFFVSEAKRDAPSSDLTTFLNSNPTFDFELADVDDTGWDFTGTDATATKAQLKAYQRLFRLAPTTDRFARAKVLYTDDLRSARQIATLSREGFLTLYSTPFGEENALEIFNRAQQQMATALTVFSVHGIGMQGPPVATLPHIARALDGASGATPADDIPNYETLFGSLGFCEVRHDESVLSPAAYFVDLLSYIKGFGASGGFSNGLAVLTDTDRRADLQDVALTEDNTQIPVPYIDLANELLEARIASGTPPTTTSGTAAQRRAIPEHRNDTAYTTLTGAVYPFNLPWSRPVAQLRQMMRHLGLARPRFLDDFRTSDTSPTAKDIAGERIGLHPSEWSVLNNIDSTPHTRHARWGDSSANWSALSDVETFLDRAAASQEELYDLLHTGFISTPTTITVEFTDECDLSTGIIKKSGSALSNSDDYMRMAGLLRLSRRLGWSVLDLDRAITHLSGEDTVNTNALFTDTFRIDLGVLKQLHARTGLPVVALLSWWSTLDTFSGRAINLPEQDSLYDQLFQAAGLSDAVLTAFALNSNRDELVTAGGGTPYTIGSYDTTTNADQPAVTAALLAALGVDDEALQDLVAHADVLNGSDTLNLANLSTLYRWRALAEACGLSVADLLRFVDTSGLTPFTSTREDTLDFLDAVGRMKQGAPNLATLSWVLAHDATAAAELGKTEDAQQTTLGELWLVLSQVQHDDDASRKTLQVDALNTEVASRTGLDKDIAALLTSTLTANSTAIEDLFTATTSGGFLDPTHTQDTVFDASTYPDLNTGWTRLEKAALLLSSLEVDADDVDWLLTANNTTHFFLLNVNTLPGNDTDAAADHTLWDATARLFDLRRHLDLDALSLPALLTEAKDHSGNSTDEDDFRALLLSGTTWQSSDLDYLLATHWTDYDAGGGSWTTTIWQNVARWERLFTAMVSCENLGLSIQQVGPWATSPIDTDLADAVQEAARSRHEAETWYSIVEPIQDVLRTEQRDHLLSHLLHSEGLTTSKALYDILLIDAEMSACTLTSRLKLALSTAQLFVHRVLLNLEANTSVDADQLVQWEWMKNYRVWEAARKIFLWPENWIEPELRTGKTALFDRLENQLHQGPLEEEALEEAFEGYLGGLVDVGNLQVVSFYHHQESDDDGEIDNLYVFARTRGTPARYHWRVLKDRSVWSPWEPIELDIPGKHLIPVVYNGRLLLMWPIFVDASRTYTSAGGEGEVSITWEYWSAQMTFSEYRSGGWTQPVVSSESVDILLSGRGSNYYVDKDAVFFRTAPPSDPKDPDALVITAWVLEEDEDTGDGDATTTTTLLASWLLDDCVGEFRGVDWSELVNTESDSDVPTGNPADTLPSATLFEGATSLRLSTNQEADPHDQPLLLTSAGDSFWVVGPHDRWNFDADETVCFFGDTKRAYAIWNKTPDTRGDSTVEYTITQVFTAPPESADFTPPSHKVTPSTLSPSMGIFSQPTRMNLTDTTLASSTRSTTRSRSTVSSSTSTRSSQVQISTASRTFSAERSRYQGTQTTSTSLRNVDAANKADTYFGMAKGTKDGILSSSALTSGVTFDFSAFHHPYACLMMTAVRRAGVWGLLKPTANGAFSDLARQAIEDTTAFDTRYSPTYIVASASSDTIDFTYGSPFGAYNWELFFHTPVYIADALMRDLQFDEALKWLQVVFNPNELDGQLPKSAWRIKPFYQDELQPVTDLQSLVGATSEGESSTVLENFTAQLRQWREAPFDPHGLAALRTTAYQKFVVMRYLDVLITWGDHLFRQDTIESINEAAQLYILALEILGDEPEAVQRQTEPTAFSYDDITTGSATVKNLLDDVEQSLGRAPTGGSASASQDLLQGFESLMYFAVPANPKLMLYWDTVKDRLYKIRNCMNLSGAVRQLPLFQPPIDPALLVRAAAAGVDLSSAASSLTISRPHYRYSVLTQRAQAYCGTTRALGGALLSALEKKDAEGMAALRSGHETTILSMLKESQRLAVKEATTSLKGLKQQRKVTEGRKQYYDRLLATPLSNREEAQLDSLTTALHFSGFAAQATLQATMWGVIPRVMASTTGVETEVVNPEKRIEMLGMAATGLNTLGSLHLSQSSITGIRAGHERREAEWEFQVEQADKELAALDEQIEAAEIRLESARHQQSVQAQQLKNAQEVASYLTSKFTSVELYDWMIGQLSALYFQSYQLAFDMARKAEAAWQIEQAETDQTFIQYGYWDSLKKGLLAGERLQLDLERMDAAYLNADVRELELTKHVSVSRLDPMALELLRQSGACWVEVPEALFDLDCPGHYLRRLSSVAITVACVSGAQRQINLELTLVESSIRTEASTDSSALSTDTTTEMIVTSAAVEDPGVFSGGGDGRYQPFERFGAISKWKLRFCNQDFPQFDWSTISDVVLHLRYTARDGGDAFRSSVVGALDGVLRALTGGYSADGTASTTTGLVAVVDARRDDPDAFYQAQQGSATALTLTVGDDRLPYFTGAGTVALTAVYVIATGITMDGATNHTTLTLPTGSPVNVASVASNWKSSGAVLGEWTSPSPTGWPDTATVTLNHGDDWSTAEDVVFLFVYDYTDSVS